jgi:hypothetical protein
MNIFPGQVDRAAASEPRGNTLCLICAVFARQRYRSGRPPPDARAQPLPSGKRIVNRFEVVSPGAQDQHPDFSFDCLNPEFAPDCLICAGSLDSGRGSARIPALTGLSAPVSLDSDSQGGYEVEVMSPELGLII